MKEHLEEVSARFKKLQEKLCTIIQQSDGLGRFTKDVWEKDVGYGITEVISNGGKIEKGAINFSKVSGPLNKRMSQAIGVEADEFSATGISTIFHGKNPFTPTIHMNVRYFSFNNGVEWFGGGIDLTPMYINIEEARNFHSSLKEICDKYDHGFYKEFKKWADEYFFLEHRDETRGIGGIFFDRMKPDKNMKFRQWLNFTSELAELYPLLYTELMERNASKAYCDTNVYWQKIRRGRYVEFNLIYDRGTKFGLESKGNTESILVSLPPEVRWDYNYLPQKGSEEERTQQLLKKQIDWINYPS